MNPCAVLAELALCECFVTSAHRLDRSSNDKQLVTIWFPCIVRTSPWDGSQSAARLPNAHKSKGNALSAAMFSKYIMIGNFQIRLMIGCSNATKMPSYAVEILNILHHAKNKCVSRPSLYKALRKQREKQEKKMRLSSVRKSLKSLTSADKGEPQITFGPCGIKRPTQKGLLKKANPKLHAKNSPSTLQVFLGWPFLKKAYYKMYMGCV